MPNGLRLLAVDALPRVAFSPGTPLAAGGRATVDYVAAAMRFVNDGHAAAIVASRTVPIRRARPLAQLVNGGARWGSWPSNRDANASPS